MVVAYLINRYPTPSHSFIRREIRALENTGIQVHRFSIRNTASTFLDDLDTEELQRTRVVLARPHQWLLDAPGFPLKKLLANVPGVLKLAIGSERGPFVHMAYLLEATRIAKWCREAGVDHLHAHFATNPAVVALLVHRLTGLPFSFTVHGPEVFDRPTLLALEEKVAGAKFVACVSEFTRGQLCRWSATEDWSKLHVVRCGLDFEALDQKKHRVSTRLVCIGRLCEQKGYLHLLEALERLAARGVRPEVVVLGDGPLRESLERRVRESGLNVELKGWATQREVFEEIARARAVLCPSLAEGLPVVLMEAMALKRPVVASWVCGIPELVEAGRNGWLVPPGDTLALADAIQEMTEASEEKLTEMGQQGFSKVSQQHDIRREAEKLTELFQQV
jgi:colanic acid/amylovoran biosynthesis glycosyltransferase